MTEVKDMQHSATSITPSIELVATIYEALGTGNTQALQNIVTDDVTWNVTEGFPYAGTYSGLDAVLRGFYERVRNTVEKLSTEKIKWIDAGQHVIVLGYYRIKVKNDPKEYRVRFSHNWELLDGKVAGIWQVADTVLLPQGLLKLR
jgi:ketosteroid isomerase-like protein